MSFFSRKKIGMVVCDMAGTIINEKGLIYKSIYDTLMKMGIRNISEIETYEWHGCDKTEVLGKYLKNINDIKKAERILISNLRKQYFENNRAEIINDELFDFFEKLRINNVKVCLNTGYPKKFQEEIITHFNISEHIDDYISSEEVLLGRPYPYMIHNLMERNTIISSKNVMKIGDTVNDMMEGYNANCGEVIGVLTGADNKDDLINGGAKSIVHKITDLKECELPIFFL